MANLFLERFPEETDFIEFNRIRMKGFVKYNKQKRQDACKIAVKSAYCIQEINDLGFITIESQEGILRKTVNPVHLYGVEKGKRYKKQDGVNQTLEIYTERAFCEGFIKNELLDVFKKEMTDINKNIQIITKPYSGEQINLTTTFRKYQDGKTVLNRHTNLNETTDEELRMNSHVFCNSGYYLGPKLKEDEDFYIADRKRWTLIIAIDMTYGHHALRKDGLFTAIKKSLVKALTTYE